jgi:acetylornithine deacetylase
VSVLSVDDLTQQRVRAAVSDGREECVGLLQGLVRAARDGEDAAQQFVDATRRTWGLGAETVRRSPATLRLPGELVGAQWLDARERTSVFGRWHGAGAGPSLMVWVHPDSPPLLDARRWSHDPYGAEREDGRIYGLGAADDRSGIAAALAAVQTLQQAGIRTRGDVLIGSCASKDHAQGVVAGFELGFIADASIYLHPAESGHGLADIKGATSGVLAFRVALAGRQPETTEPNQVPFADQGVNAIDSLIPVIDALRRMEHELAGYWRHAALEEAMGGRATRLSLETVEAESGFGRIPTSCRLGATLVFPPGVALAEAQAAVEAALDACVPCDGWTAVPRAEWLFGTEGAEVPESHPLFQVTRAAIEAATGRRPSMYRLHCNSDIRVPHHFNRTPCVGFGPLAGNSSQIGMADEWVDEAGSPSRARTRLCACSGSRAVRASRSS